MLWGNPEQKRTRKVDPQQKWHFRVTFCDVDKDKDGRKAVRWTMRHSGGWWKHQPPFLFLDLEEAGPSLVAPGSPKRDYQLPKSPGG